MSYFKIVTYINDNNQFDRSSYYICMRCVFLDVRNSGCNSKLSESSVVGLATPTVVIVANVVGKPRVFRQSFTQFFSVFYDTSSHAFEVHVDTSSHGRMAVGGGGCD